MNEKDLKPEIQVENESVTLIDVPSEIKATGKARGAKFTSGLFSKLFEKGKNIIIVYAFKKLMKNEDVRSQLGIQIIDPITLSPEIKTGLKKPNPLKVPMRFLNNIYNKFIDFMYYPAEETVPAKEEKEESVQLSERETQLFEEQKLKEELLKDADKAILYTDDGSMLITRNGEERLYRPEGIEYTDSEAKAYYSGKPSVELVLPKKEELEQSIEKSDVKPIEKKQKKAKTFRTMLMSKDEAYTKMEEYKEKYEEVQRENQLLKEQLKEQPISSEKLETIHRDIQRIDSKTSLLIEATKPLIQNMGHTNQMESDDKVIDPSAEAIQMQKTQDK